MATKKISDLQLRSSFDVTCNIPVDDASQTWRSTGAQVKAFIESTMSAALVGPTTQVFTSGSGTYTKPANVKWIKVTVTGGGGTGGTGYQASGGMGGSGGGGGGTAIKKIVNPASTYSYAVGAANGDSTFSTLTGGKGANGGSAIGSNYGGSGGTGGTASGGDINVTGQGGGNGTPGVNGQYDGVGGIGGSSAMGGGGGVAGQGASGRAGGSYGGGGSGAGGTVSATSPGAGASGIVLVEEFYQ